MEKEITLVEVEEMQVLGIQRQGLYSVIPELLVTIFRYAKKRRLTITGPPVVLFAESIPDHVRIAHGKEMVQFEVAWPVSGVARGSGDIQAHTLAGGPMVHTIHTGPYETCESTYLRLSDWIERHHLTICGPIRERYPHNPHWLPRDEIITEIFIPVQIDRANLISDSSEDSSLPPSSTIDS